MSGALDHPAARRRYEEVASTLTELQRDADRLARMARDALVGLHILAGAWDRIGLIDTDLPIVEEVRP